MPDSTEDDHREVMAALARARGWRRGVELGLGQGQLFARFLALGIEMTGVDLGLRPDRRASVEALGAAAQGSTVHWTATTSAAPLVADGWADFVFIDAAHSYGAVRDDIRHWAPKVRPGGWLGGHDYHPRFPGVIRAVDEAFAAIDLPGGHIWARI